jgi:hypothetical protein
VLAFNLGSKNPTRLFEIGGALSRRLSFKGWLKRLPNEVIWKLANEWRRDFQRTEAIQNEYKRRLRLEEKMTRVKKGNA